MGGRAGFAHFAALAIAVAAVGAAPVGAKPKAAPAPKPADLRGPAYIEQLGAPPDWPTDEEFWIETESLVPPQVLDPGRSDKVVIAPQARSRAGPTRSSTSISGAAATAHPSARPAQANALETVQVSPGAMAGRWANAGAGNGSEYDVFGYEVDPGRSGAHNSSPEPGDSAVGGAASGNVARQDQSGSDDFARIVQIGAGNDAGQVQRGNSNTSVIVQRGRNNRAEAEQQGDGKTSVISQSGTGNTAVVKQ